MKTLIFGSSGMLGHVLSYYFKKKYKFDVILCSRSKTDIAVLDEILVQIPEYSKKQVSTIIDKYRPCNVINCAGITNANTSEEKLNLINSELPKLLANILNGNKDGSRLIHISTNGVFSGKRGDYVESDLPDSIDNYGKS